MKKILLLASVVCALFVSTSYAVTSNIISPLDCDPSIVGLDVFDLKMVAKVPRIYDNTTSRGYRKYQNQLIKGKLYIIYRDDGSLPEIRVVDLVNKTHKINGNYVTYNCTVRDSNDVVPLCSIVGDNAKNVFNKGSIAFGLDAEPSYNVGEDEPDNSLLITMSGICSTVNVGIYKWYGSSYYKYLGSYYQLKTWNGFFAGTLGCGCKAYGHKSPTRVAGAAGATDQVIDIAAVCGKWSAHYRSAESWRVRGFECY